MKILVDTNIVTRSAQPDHPNFSLVRDSIRRLLELDETLCIVPQIIYEFWSVATRPLNENGLGFTTAKADSELSKLFQVFDCLSRQDDPFSDHIQLFPVWRNLVVKYDVKGKNSHDARIVAAMKAYSLTHILTSNKRDFERFDEVTILTPENVTRKVQTKRPRKRQN